MREMQASPLVAAGLGVELIGGAPWGHGEWQLRAWLWLQIKAPEQLGVLPGALLSLHHVGIRHLQGDSWEEKRVASCPGAGNSV